MTPLSLTLRQRRALCEQLRQTSDARVYRRPLAILESDRGRGVADIAQLLHTSRRSVYRWRVERTFAWFGQCRLLSKEYEKTVKSAEAWLWCAMMRLLVRRLAV